MKNGIKALDQGWSRYGLIAFVIMVFACFIAWLVIAAFPAVDTQRDRTAIALKGGKTLTVDYPRRILADDSTAVVYLTVDSLESISITIGLPPSLPLILSSIVPSSTVNLDENIMGGLILAWPTPTAQPIPTTLPTLASLDQSDSPGIGLQPTSSSEAVGIAQATPTVDISPLVIVSESSTSTVDNTTTIVISGLISGTLPNQSSTIAPTIPFTPTPTSTPTGILPVTFQPHTISLYFKNTNSQRSPLPFWPFSSGFVNTSFHIGDGTIDQPISLQVETTDRANWRALAKEYSFLVLLPTFVAALGFLYKSYTDQRALQKQEASKALEDFKQAVASATKEDFMNQWNNLQKYSKHMRPDELERARRLYDFVLGRISVIDEAAIYNSWADSWAGAVIMADRRKAQDQETILRLVRVFPKDQLSTSSERRFKDLDGKLKPITPQQHTWPKPAELPEDYKTGWTNSIDELNVFPYINAESSDECRYLFSTKPWFWREHAVYQELVQARGATLVCGELGCGRTALALSLTRYAKATDLALGVYYSRSASVSDAQNGLAQELLNFICWRSTWLTDLTGGDRELLAKVLISVLDRHFVLSMLGAPVLTQFDQSDPYKDIWWQQARVEFDLLRQSIDRLSEEPPLSPPQWFHALIRCLQALKFRHVRIALDLTSEQYEQWRSDHSWQFVSSLPSSYDFPVQLIVLVPGQKEEFDIQRLGASTRQLRWDGELVGGETPLVLMLRYRVETRLGDSRTMMEEFMPDDIQRKMCEEAQYNPRLLAELWQRIVRANPNAKRITETMIPSPESENA